MKKINWSYALGEIALIFIGITLAIAFQNWNENRKQNNLERSVLQQLEVALNNDLEDVRVNINTHQRGITACNNVLKMLHAKEPIDEQKMLANLGQSVDFTFLISDVSTYEYLKSVGLHIIKNDTLRNRITKLYDVAYEGIYGVENNAKPVQLKIVENLRKYFTSDTTFFRARKGLQKAKKDEDLKFDVRNLEYAHNNMINKYKKKVLPELEAVLEAVRLELE